MDNFNEIIAPLLDKKSRIRNINIKEPNKRIYKKNRGNAKPVITPLGRFETCQDAATAHGCSKSAMSAKLLRKTPGYEYDVEL